MGSEVFGAVSPDIGHREGDYDYEIERIAKGLDRDGSLRRWVERAIKTSRELGRRYLVDAVYRGFGPSPRIRAPKPKSSDRATESHWVQNYEDALREARWRYARAAYLALCLKTA